MMLPNRAFQDERHDDFLWKAGKPAALLVHGFPGTPAEMRPLAQMLHDAGWTTRGLLLPGFGAQIESLLQTRQATWAAAVDEALAALQREHSPVIMVGFSMGGALTLEAAARRKPDGMALLAPFWQVDHILWKLLPVLRPIFRGVKPFRIIKLDFNDPETRAGMRNFMPDADFDSPDVQQAIRDLRLPLDLFDQIRRTGQLAYRSIDQLPPEMPILVIQGRKDDLVRPALTRRLVQRLAGPVSYVELNARHDLPVPTAPAWPQVQRLVLEFSQSLLPAIESATE